MKVFLSWSGSRSQAVATALRDWLGLVLHFVEPWMSQQDIAAGERWSVEVGKELEGTNFGILCLTKENIGAPWLLFEAGALSKSMTEGAVVPYLLDVEFSDILRTPLGLFQGKKAEEAGTFELVQAINGRAKAPVDATKLKRLFDMAWPALEKQLGAIPAGQDAVTTKSKPQAQILEELVTIVRSMAQRLAGVEARLVNERRGPGRLLFPVRPNTSETTLPVHGEKIREVRERKGISKGEFAQQMRLSEEDIEPLERGFNTMAPEFLDRISNALGVSFAELLGLPQKDVPPGEQACQPEEVVRVVGISAG